jgi:hypothetical protein
MVLLSLFTWIEKPKGTREFNFLFSESHHKEVIKLRFKFREIHFDLQFNTFYLGSASFNSFSGRNTDSEVVGVIWGSLVLFIMVAEKLVLWFLKCNFLCIK